ncbi:MAG: hypothetical protein ACLFO2_01010 [Candidatus Woesearchaeota archaeon]
MRYSFIAIVALAVLLVGCASDEASSGVPDGQDSSGSQPEVAPDGSDNEAGDAVLPGANDSSENLVDDDLDQVMDDLSMDDW